MSFLFGAKTSCDKRQSVSSRKAVKTLSRGSQKRTAKQSQNNLRRSLRDGVLALERPGYHRNSFRHRSCVTP